MSNFGRKYDPNKRAYNKMKKEHTVDHLRMQRESNKKSKRSNYSKRIRTRNTSVSWGMLILGTIIAFILKY